MGLQLARSFLLMKVAGKWHLNAYGEAFLALKAALQDCYLGYFSNAKMVELKLF